MAKSAKLPNGEKEISVLESTCFAKKPMTVDREKGMIFGVKICSAKSDNGYRYQSEALKNAVTLYENKSVMIDHPPLDKARKNRPLRETFGKIKNPRYEKGSTPDEEGVYGDIKCIKAHEMANVVFEMAEEMPDEFGMSHNADAIEDRNGDIVRIARVRSVDLVRNPATTKSLFESRNEERDMENDSDDKPKTKNLKFKDIIEKAGLVVLLEEEMMSPMSASEVAVPDGSGVDSDAAMKAAFRSAITAAFDDDSLDFKATMVRIKDLVKSYYKVAGKDDAAEGDAGGSESEGGSDDKPPTMESLQKQLDDFKEEKKVRVLLESSQVDATEDDVEVLVGLNDKARKTFIDRLPKRGKDGGKSKDKPRTGSVLESVNDDEAEVPKFKDAADKISFLRSR